MLLPTARWICSALLGGMVPCLALGQDRDGNEIGSSVEDAAVSIEAAFDCNIDISGEPVFREFSRKWEMAFSASGADCDAAYQELQRRVMSLEVLLYRRPNLDQVRSIIVGILTSVRSFGCAITLPEEPSFNETSGQWLVPYRASGNGCDDASEFLRDIGAEQQIAFWRVVSRQDLIR
jgi:hypothetical protein